MQLNSGRSSLRLKLLVGFKIALFVTVFNDLFFFVLFPVVRETTLGILSRLMEPLLLATPLALAGICLVGYLLTFVFPDHH